MFRAHVDEMNVETVDLGDEVWQRGQLRLAWAPVIFRSPITRKLLNCRQLDALRCIRDGFLLRPPGGVDASAQFGEFRFRNTHLKRTYRLGSLLDWLCSAGLRHG